MTSTANYVTYWSDANTLTGEAQLALSRGGTNKALTASNGSIAYSDADSLELSSVGSSGYLFNFWWSRCSGMDRSSYTGEAGNYWSIAAGSLYPKNATLDFFVGGTATASAKFALLNVSSGTPTASISAGSGNSTYLTATGVLGTTNRQALTLGSSSTGNVTIAPAGSTAVTILQNGNVGIGSTSPAQALNVVGDVRISGLTASLPVKTNANKDLVSGAINLASSEVLEHYLSVMEEQELLL